LAVREAVSRHVFDANVGLIDYGQRMRDGRLTEKTAIRVHVHRKLSPANLESAVEAGLTRPVPQKILGYETDVIEGTYRPQLWGLRFNSRSTATGDSRARRADPLRGGISISDERHNAYGTLGTLVIDTATGSEMLLSNWHVLVADWTARPGQRIYQPGRLDGGTEADTVAILERHAMAANLDAAVATLTHARQLVNDQVGLGPVRGVSQAELGLSLTKSGRASGITRGRVTGVEGTAKMNYRGIERLIRDVVTIDPIDNREVSRAGDSGSCWLAQETMQAVGLHFAGSDVPERGLAVNMQSVLTVLRVRMATERPSTARPVVQARPQGLETAVAGVSFARRQ
jgi:endonuclease G